MIFEIKNYQTCKQYKIDGAVVRKSVFISVKALEKERDELKGYLEKIIQEMYHCNHDRAVYWDDRTIHLRLEGGEG